MIFRCVISLRLLREFFYDRMANVVCLYLFHLIADSIEELLVREGAPWNKTKKILGHIINITLTFSVIAGIVLYLPIYGWAINLGFDLENVDTSKIVHLWLGATAGIFALVIFIGYATREEWGSIQYLSFRLLFVLYCFWSLEWPSIIFALISAGTLVWIEGKKHNWNIKEMRKKDLRFRRIKSR